MYSMVSLALDSSIEYEITYNSSIKQARDCRQLRSSSTEQILLGESLRHISINFLWEAAWHLPPIHPPQ
jgi:hypothetical protein